ncbi:DMT family transporter [Rhizobium pusense]|uniref:EamA domain-containing protein n=3 Tax=Bacteria TaxID=2 RepID=A0A9W5B404_9HYPH|nr:MULTISPECIES: DMT family transporter [Rhizobium/Agrobacterium group]MDH0912792.1 DMT family transporter [Agrobacterium pusense]MDH1099038.1 DMT family transporter [Agrobacterium pusense]MDH1115585.1 DMT family transporter [Agrobacterium pusense]MDH2197355.1 DMT family transporter [Agrobacterium pusense]OJH60390.1 transporter [Agrobacterium pusense]
MIDKTTSGVALGFAAFAIFSLSDASVKLIAGAIPPMQSAFIGAIFGCLVLPFLLSPGDRLHDVFSTVDRRLWLVRFFAYPAGVIGSITAFTHLSMSEAMVLMFLQPSFVTMMSILFLKERVGMQRWLAIAIGFVGVLIVLRPGFRELSIGHLGAIFAGFGGAVSIVVFRALGVREKKISLVGAGLMGAIVICGALSISDFVMPDGEQILLLAGYGLLAALANLLTTRASILAPATLVGATQYGQMVWAIILDDMLFGLRPDISMMIGLMFIIGSGALTIMREHSLGRHWGAPIGGERSAAAILVHEASRNPATSPRAQPRGKSR